MLQAMTASVSRVRVSRFGEVTLPVDHVTPAYCGYPFVSVQLGEETPEPVKM